MPRSSASTSRPAIPLVYDLDDDLRPRGHHYLGDPDRVAAAAAAVAAQGSARPA